jgi:hypothetical protein
MPCWKTRGLGAFVVIRKLSLGEVQLCVGAPLPWTGRILVLHQREFNLRHGHLASCRMIRIHNIYPVRQ